VSVSLIDNGGDLVIGDRCTSPQVESAVMIKSTPRLLCLRVSRMNSSRVLHKTPAVSAGVPSKAGYRSGSKMPP
jgi:hypothetical protein